MRSIIQHLRFPFSYLLLPVFLMAIYIFPYWENSSVIILLFFILHFLVYPSSNAYNSVQDNDNGSIGLIKNPLPIKRSLTFVTLIFDFTALALSLVISEDTALFVAIYIFISRLYSSRKVRLKKFAVIGFLTVFVFQGAWIFFLVATTVGTIFITPVPEFWYFASAASFLIGSIYPLSQIYQHESDKADGVETLSMLLGKKGTFIFSGIMFLVGSILLLYPSVSHGESKISIYYFVFQLPSLIYFNYWFYKVIKDECEANFKHTMRMSLISATCMNAFFLYLIFA